MKKLTPQHLAYRRQLKGLQRHLNTLREQALGLSQLHSKDYFEGARLRDQKRRVQDELATTRGTLATMREDLITASHHDISRAYKELPHFFKFCLFKNQPKRVLVQDKMGEYIRPIHEAIDFRGIHAEVDYFRGELGGPDRMVYLAILNEAIQHKEFVWEFGYIPFSTQELATKAGFSKTSHQRQEWVSEALKRLTSTEITFQAGLSPDSPLLHRTLHLVQEVVTLGRKKLVDQVEGRVRAIQQGKPMRSFPHVEPTHDAVLRQMEQLATQANQQLDKLSDFAPHVTLVKFNEPLMRAINGHEITTVDLWSLQKLSRHSARALFLFLYDISQWRQSEKALSLPIGELLQILDLSLAVDHKHGKDYPRWNRTRDLIGEYFEEVNQYAKFLEKFEWVGEEEHSVLEVVLSDKTLQIPPR